MKKRIVLYIAPLPHEHVGHTAMYSDGKIVLRDHKGNLFELSRSETLAIAKLFKEMQEALS